MSKGKIASAIFIGVIALSVQGFTTANAWSQNVSAGVLVAGLFAVIDVSVFGLLYVASHKDSSTVDRVVCLLSLLPVAPIVIATLGQAISTGDYSSREEFNKEYIQSNTLLASTALADASLSSSEAKRWTSESNATSQRKSQYTRQSLAHSDQSKAARSQAAALLDKAKSVSDEKTRREVGLESLGFMSGVYVYYVAFVATLLSSVLGFYSFKFFGESETKTTKPNKTKSTAKPDGTGGNGKTKTKKPTVKTKTDTLKNAPKLELVKTDTKLELSRKWVLSNSEKVSVTNLSNYLKRQNEGVSNAKTRGYLLEMCEGKDKILQRTSSAKNAGFIRIKTLKSVIN